MDINIETFDTIISQKYDLRTHIAGRTTSFTKEEVLQAKMLVLHELTKENLEKFNPRLLLIDNQDQSGIIIVFAIPDEQHEFDGKESRGRTYYIQDGRVVRVIKAKPKQSAP